MREREFEMAKLVCPLCGSYTSFTPAKVKYGGLEIWVDVVTKYSIEENYAIIVCQACGKHFVAKEGTDWVAVYPLIYKKAAKEIPEPLKGNLEEASLCLATRTYMACVTVCQITLENLWRDQNASGLDDMVKKGTISPALFRRANEIRLWGNLVKHELIIDPISQEDAEQIYGYLELLLHEVYVEPVRLDALTKKRKELGKKD